MAQVRYEDQAVADLGRIVEFGLAHGYGDPVAFVEDLQARIATLATLPSSGKPGRVAGTREWVLTGTPFIAVYLERGTVDVLRVLHGAQQWP